MTCKVQVLAPVVFGSEVVTGGHLLMEDHDAAEHEMYGRVEIVERDGQPVQWAGCCSRPVDAASE